MSRYLERAEHTARLIDVHLNQILEQAPGLSTEQRWARLLQSLHLKVNESADDYAITRLLTFDTANPASIVSCIASARENARQVREQVSSEMWMQLNHLYLDLTRKDMGAVWNDQPYAFFTLVKEGSHLFQGITDATMNHNEGWHFIQLGRFIERMIVLADLLDAHYTFSPIREASPEVEDYYFEWLALLRSATAFEAYCKVYHNDLRPDCIAEFLLFNADFPRSARFCIEAVLSSLNAISGTTTLHKNSKLHRLGGRLRSALSFDEIGEVLAGDFHRYLEDIKRQSLHIHDTLYETFITYTIEAALS
jgi:uncharacterized alpha-E superfamily protein